MEKKKSTKEQPVITAYKGFDKNFKCQNFQYEIGKEYEHSGQVKCCPDKKDLEQGKGGFHACTNPHDIFGYYSAGDNNKFALVKGSGESDKNGDDSKVAFKKLKIEAEINVFDICKIAVKTFFENFGFSKIITESTTNNACYMGAANAGNYGVAIAATDGKVKGGKGAVLVLVNRDNNNNTVDFCAGIVDGEKLKPNTWYKLENGQFVEIKE